MTAKIPTEAPEDACWHDYGDKIALWGGRDDDPDYDAVEHWALDIVYNVVWTESPPTSIDFLKHFTVDPKAYAAGDDYYRGMDFWRIITRKSDGRKFGYKFWASPGNDDLDSVAEPNGDEHGLPEGRYWDADDLEVYVWGAYVFVPVEPATIPTWKVTR